MVDKKIMDDINKGLECDMPVQEPMNVISLIKVLINEQPRKGDVTMQLCQNFKKFNSYFALFAAVVLTVASLFLGGCDYLPIGCVSISDIVANPAQYEGKTVKVRGIVSGVTKIPFVDIQYYSLADNGSQITVFPGGALPVVQANITVIGLLENITIIGNQGFGVHLKETKRVDNLF